MKAAMNGQRVIAATTAFWVMLVGGAAAQGYPDRTIDLIVPSTPGSSADILGRVLTEEMAGKLGQRFIIYNKLGAGGVLGTAEVSRAKPDGYTLMHGAAFSVDRAALHRAAAPATAPQSFEPICQTFKNDQVMWRGPAPTRRSPTSSRPARPSPAGSTSAVPGSAPSRIWRWRSSPRSPRSRSTMCRSKGLRNQSR